MKRPAEQFDPLSGELARDERVVPMPASTTLQKANCSAFQDPFVCFGRGEISLRALHFQFPESLSYEI